MKRGTLGISWLNETLTAAWAGRDGAVQTWHAPAAVKDGAMLSGVMRDVCRRSGEDLRRVVVLMDHRNLLFHVQETPPAKGRLLDQMLDRLIGENRFFDEPSVWAKLELPPGARHHRWLLALTPQSIWNDIKSACDDNELDLVGLYPATALLARHLGKVRAEPGEAVLLIADFGGSHGLLVGRGDGQILFARSIAASRSETEGRLDQEINRTLHFAEQRFGGKVSRIVAMGERCESALSGRPLREGLNVETLVADLEDPALAAAGSEGGSSIRLNFVRRSLWQSPWARPLLAAGMAALLLVSMSTAAWVLDEARTRSSEQERWKREVRAAARIRETRLSRRREWESLRALVLAVGDPDQPAVISSFCRYLQTTTPAAMRLTGLDLAMATNGWTLRLEGISREQGGRFVTGIEEWEAGLTGGVFRVRVVDSTQRRTVAGSSVGLGSTLPMNVEGKAASNTEAGEKGFFLSGTIP